MHVAPIIEARLLRANDIGQDDRIDRINRVKVKRQKAKVKEQQWNIEYRTRNSQCQSLTLCLSAFVALVIDYFLLAIDYCSVVSVANKN